MPSPFDMFDRHDPSEPQGSEGEANQQSDTVTLTRAEFDKMIDAQNSERKRSEDMWKHMLQTGPQARSEQLAPAAPQFEVDLNGLPDPSVDVEGYHKGLGERLGKTYKDMVQQAIKEAGDVRNSEQSQANLMDTAWKRLAENNSEVAAHPEIVEIAANKYFAGLRQQGLDPMRALSLDMDGVIAEVAASASGIINGIRGDDAPDPNRDSGRTTMLSGNGSARSRAKAKATENVEQPGDFLAELKKLQREQRLY